MTPCRVLDTRNTTARPFSGTIPVSVSAERVQCPSRAGLCLQRHRVPQNGPLGYLTLWPDAEGKPVVSTLNALDGAVTSNMAIVPTLNGYVDAFATNPTDLILDIFSYFAPVRPLTITTTALPCHAELRLQHHAGCNRRRTPYSWSITSGILPQRASLSIRKPA